ncbi:MAG: acetyl/propionyl-CoA carboxylase subunit alpha, partial [Cryobacterium sp.]|nr:acetyl/propionyl-CoA carboxylase subunit alpha [Cryobacterium sp.]
SAGGGGKGMHPVHTADELPDALASARRVAKAAFGDDTLLLERLISTPRHIEVQLLADAHGTVIHLGERECSLQRRHQKVIEEAPSPLLDAATRDRIGEAAKTVARSVDYVGAGTVEFLVSADRPDEFFFMEMNTRLQVEHPVTELVTGVDLVEWQVRVASGERLELAQEEVRLRGHAIEARVYAEDPERGFLPSTGTVVALSEPSGAGIRVDSSLRDGLVIPADYDPMLSKVIAWGADRDQALQRLDRALARTTVLGVRTNVEYLRALLADPDVQAGDLDTGLIERRLPDLRFRRPDAVAYVAAALAAGAPTAASGAWAAHPGWRSGSAPGPERFVFAAHSLTADSDERIEVLLAGDRSSAFTATVAGSDHAARLVADRTANGQRELTIELDAHTSTFVVAHSGSTLWIGSDGWSWPIERISRERELRDRLARIERESHPASPEVRSPMPGTVVTVSVATGDEVVVGDTIVTVEAMKMEHRLTAPVSGRVTVSVVAGGLVRLDQVVATIEPEGTEPAGTEASSADVDTRLKETPS